jgi:hypothetical protein
MNVSVGAVNQHLSRGLASLRQDPHLLSAIELTRSIPA